MPSDHANPVSRPMLLRWLALGTLAWVLLAAIPTSSAYLAAGSGGVGRWLFYFSYIGLYYFLWALSSPGIYRLAIGPLHPRHGWARSVTGHLALFGALSLVFGFLVHHENWQLWLAGANTPGYYAMSAFSYFFILLGVYLYSLQQRVREQDAIIASQHQQALRLESDLARAQLQALRGQMNPHFLFNALNCIGALIETRQNDAAYEALEDLGGLLRTSLEHRNHELISLADEIAFTRRYVAMERVRFGDRLQVEMDTDQANPEWQVPPFILQPLIENAIKHAVAPSSQPVSIRVLARPVGRTLQLSVADTGSGCPHTPEGTGLGLSNLKQRLQLCYGEAGRLEFQQDGRGTEVSLWFPWTDGTTGKEMTTSEKTVRAGH